MAYGLVRHHGKLVKAAFWRPGGNKPKQMSITIEIGRSGARYYMKTYPGGKLPTPKGPGFWARVCLSAPFNRLGHRQARLRGDRCAFADARSPTSAMKVAVRKLLKRIK